MTRAYDPTDPDQFEERQEDASRRREQEVADWRFILESPQGRRVVADLLRACGLVQASFSTDALVMAYGEGRRSIAGHIYTLVTSVAEGRHVPALLAEVMAAPNVRNARRPSPRDPAGR